MITVKNTVREFVVLGLGEIPEVGWLIKGFGRILWPESKEDIWKKIKDQAASAIVRSA